MLEVKSVVAAAAVGDWIPLNRRSFGTVGFTVSPDNGAGGTYAVNFTESPIQSGIKGTPYTRSTTTLTVTLTAHGLATSDDVVIMDHSTLNGVYRVATVTNANVITVTVADSGPAAGTLTIAPVIVDTVTDFVTASGKTSGNIFASTVAIRLNCANGTTAPHRISINQFES